MKYDSLPRLFCFLCFVEKPDDKDNTVKTFQKRKYINIKPHPLLAFLVDIMTYFSYVYVSDAFLS